MSHWLYGLPIIEKLKLGNIGVEMFFVISGFLISLQLFKYKLDINTGTSLKKTLKVFYIRRVLRIFPLYYFILIIATLINKGELADAFIWNFTYTTNFYIIKVHHWPSIFSQFWSLSVEEHFYIFWPLIVLVSNTKNIIRWIFIIAIVSMAFRLLYFQFTYDYILLNIHTLSCLDLFMMGALLANIFYYNQSFFIQLFNYKYLSVFTMTLFIVLFLIYFIKPQWELFNWVFQRSFFGIFYFLILGFFVQGIKGKMGIILENRVLIRLGKLSYCIYLIHNFVPGILLPVKNMGIPLIPEFCIYFVVTLLISEILYQIIEKPMRSLNRYFQIKST
jgi:peptidoglycan/LPS O-acetylase OafA/YrhL